MKFDGETYQPERDHDRLQTQYERVAALMADGKWRTLEEIGRSVKAPPASVSARLRDMRKERNGSHSVERRLRGKSTGLYEYQVDGGAQVPWDAESGELFGRSA